MSDETGETNQDNNPVIKDQRRRIRGHKKRKSIYQTEDLIRELSPQPDADTTEEVGDSGHDNNGEDNTTTSATTSTSTSKRLTVQCNICKRRMKESKLANHIRRLHVQPSQDEDMAVLTGDTKRKEFKCDQCGKYYALNYTYQQHIKTHTEGKPKCPECGSTFASAFSLFRHRARCHNLQHNYTLHSCDSCDKTFFSISELKLHQQRHSTLKEFKCTMCEKAFSVKGNLRIHMRTHAKEKLYKCDICPNSFSHPYSLVSHRRIHTNDFPFKCPNCEKCK